jgi:hypothetical protein
MLAKPCPRCSRLLTEANCLIKQMMGDDVKVLICECGYFVEE